MKRILLTLGLLGVLGTGAATAQTRISVSIGFGAPAPFVVYHPRSYYSHPYVVYHPRRAVVVVRPYRPARVVVIRPRHHSRRHHRRW